MARNLADLGWAHVELLDEVDSTNARALAAPRAWQLVAAHAQTAGRGRLDRQWQTPAGAAVTMSMTLPLPDDAAAWGWIPLFVGDAVRAALVSLDPTTGDEGGGERFATKWPNDVLARDADGQWRKVAGILCQVAPGHLVVAGVGVNVGQDRDELPVPTATSTSLVGLAANRDGVLGAVAAHVARAARAWTDETALADLRDGVRRHCRTIGSVIDVHTPDGRVERLEGVGLDETGRLLTRSPGSRPGAQPTMAFSVADVIHARLGDDDAEGEA